VQPTVERFRALARSSPWRWRTLHLTRHDARGALEAWVRRPGEQLVRGDGFECLEREDLRPVAASFVAWSSTDPDFVPPPLPPRVWPQDISPALDTDGFVVARPTDWNIEYGDPMYQDYTWVAMLDPHELSHDVLIDSLAPDEVRGRAVWRARLRPTDGYEPQCTCCPLLPNEPLARIEYADSPTHLAVIDATAYPTAFDVALDVQTGVVVEVRPVDGDGSHLTFSVDVHDVDGDVDAVFARR
jgi:hypothetical protein